MHDIESFLSSYNWSDSFLKLGRFKMHKRNLFLREHVTFKVFRIHKRCTLVLRFENIRENAHTF